MGECLSTAGASGSLGFQPVGRPHKDDRARFPSRSSPCSRPRFCRNRGTVVATPRSCWVWTYGTHSAAVVEEFANIHREPIADLPLPYKRISAGFSPVWRPGAADGVVSSDDLPTSQVVRVPFGVKRWEDHEVHQMENRGGFAWRRDRPFGTPSVRCLVHSFPGCRSFLPPAPCYR